MRIIAGKWRTRKIDWPDHGTTRPITDRVKEAFFDALGSRMGTPGALPPITIADVFCGGGSLGLEALSRGAQRVCFFERDRKALRVLKRNLTQLDTGPEATVVANNVWLAGVQPPASWNPFDLVFLDPPFADARDVSSASKVASLLLRLASSGVTLPSVTVVLRHEARVVIPDGLAKGWTVDQRREYGTNALSFLSRIDRSNGDDRDELLQSGE